MDRRLSLNRYKFPKLFLQIKKKMIIGKIVDWVEACNGCIWTYYNIIIFRQNLVKRSLNNLTLYFVCNLTLYYVSWLIIIIIITFILLSLDFYKWEKNMRKCDFKLVVLCNIYLLLNRWNSKSFSSKFSQKKIFNFV